MEERRNVWMWIVLAVVLLFLVSSFGMGGYGMMGVGMGVGWIFMLLFWAAVIWVVVMLVNVAQSAVQSGKKVDGPLTVLKRRYASGEISKAQYEKMKRELE